MLEKLEFARAAYKRRRTGNLKDDVFTDSNSFQNDSVDFKKAFQDHLSSCLKTPVSLEPSSRGRLGVTYKVVPVSGRVLFCKTHKSGDRFKHSIEKESNFIAVANKGFDIRKGCFQFQKNNYTYMLQEWLEEENVVTPDTAIKLIKNFNSIFLKSQSLLNQTTYGIQDLILVAKEELPFLESEKEFSDEFAFQLQNHITFFEDNIDSLKKELCHGDFGDKNIMKSTDGRYVVIDWEDCFDGIEGYDYLYWLTFFNHRKYYTTETFVASGVESGLAKGIISVIMTIKTAMSVYSGLNKSNSMSSQDRIEEMLSHCNY